MSSKEKFNRVRNFHGQTFFLRLGSWVIGLIGQLGIFVIGCNWADWSIGLFGVIGWFLGLGDWSIERLG